MSNKSDIRRRANFSYTAPNILCTSLGRSKDIRTFYGCHMDVNRIFVLYGSAESRSKLRYRSTREMECAPIHDALKPLAWLEGTWRAENTGEGKFPTIKSFKFSEEINFTSIGQPMLNYTGQSWHPEKKKPMHREVGFLKIIPGTNKVSLVLAHNFGLTTVEEGQFNEKEIKLKSISITRISEGCKDPAVVRIEREFRLVGSQLEQILCMATTTVSETTEHIHTVYQKVEK